MYRLSLLLKTTCKVLEDVYSLHCRPRYVVQLRPDRVCRTIASRPGMSYNCVPTGYVEKTLSRPSYVVQLRPDPSYVAK